MKCPVCGRKNDIEDERCIYCKSPLQSSEKNVDFVNSGYESARKVLSQTVSRGKNVESEILVLLSELGYKENIDFEYEKKIAYDSINLHATINEDFVFPKASNPKTIISATHSHPTIPGHSNENKLHQALGELWLLKTYYEDIRFILYIGGVKENWLPYVNPVLDYFYDATIHAWDISPKESLKNALEAPLKHKEFWEKESFFRQGNNLSSDDSIAPIASLRTKFFRDVILKNIKLDSPDKIDNIILKEMVDYSLKRRGKFWNYLREGNVDKLWSERSENNPPEFAMKMLLESRNFDYKSDLVCARKEMSVKPNLLLDMGFPKCERRTDFILHTKDGIKVLIECKSAGGGEGGNLTKHITDRSREQIARSIIHRCSIGSNGELVSSHKDFWWFYILDGKWKTPLNYNLKYVHTLEMGGIDQVFSCDDLVDQNFEPNYDFKLLDILENIGCVKNSKKFDLSHF